MSFRGRLRLFFAIIVIVPMVAVGAVLFSLTEDSERGKADAGIAAGVNATLSLYRDARAAARPSLRRVARDRGLARALRGGATAAAAVQLRRAVRRDPRVVSAVLRDPAAKLTARAGSRDGVAAAVGALETGGGERIGMLAVSVTEAGAFVARAKRLTDLEVLLLRDGEAVGRTLPGIEPPGRGSSDVEAHGRELRSRREPAATVAGIDEEVVVLRPAGDVNEAITTRRLIVGGILGAFLALALGGSVFVVRALQAQIALFLEAARTLAGGRFDRPVVPHGDDEFAALAQEFNSMSARVESQVAQLERQRHELNATIRRVGEAFAGGLDRNGTFELAVETAVEACEADTGRGLPLDRDVLAEARSGATDSELDAALEQVERESVAVGPDTGRELLEAHTRRVTAKPTTAEVDGVHALGLAVRARTDARVHAQYVAMIAIARRGRAFSQEESDLLEYLVTQAAISIENADLHETVQRQALTDELTGLANLRQLHGALDREFERSRRFDTPIGFVLIDLDDFKQINDELGHQQGDLVLAEVGRVMREFARDIDQPARYGGEELAVILPQTGIAGSAMQAERLREAIERLRVVGVDREIGVTASFGVASAFARERDKTALIAAADAALYRAKRAGKNRVERAEEWVAER
jgi:diguanylate cyclase (GGDEF)-like protein